MKFPDRTHPGMGVAARALAASLIAAALVAACGGGSLYIGIDGRDDDPPQVSLVADRSQGAPGEVVRLAAAATDDSGYVDRVRFYRVDSGGSALLGVDIQPPFEASFIIPNDGRSTVSVYARAVDGYGQEGESGLVTIGVSR